MRKKITICTPTFNRGELLKSLFNSLKEQNFPDFEWIVVDDGSNDNTSTIIEDFKRDSPFPIVYLKKKNGGKHTALNTGIQHANGELCWIVDSDDYITNNSLNFIWQSWINIEDKKQFAGISGLRAHPNGSIIGNTISDVFIDTDCLSYRYKYKIQGDKAEVYRTDILKKFTFPVFENERFMTEAVVWNRIANEGYKLRWTNEIICICDYLNDGLTSNSDKNIMDSWEGTTLYYKEIMSYKQIPIKDKLFNTVRSYIHYIYLKKLRFKEIFRITKNPFYIIFAFSLYELKLMKRWNSKGEVSQ